MTDLTAGLWHIHWDIYALSLYKNKLSIKKIVNLPEADQKSLDKHTKAHYHIRNQSVSSRMLSVNFISPHLRAYDYDLHEDRYVISLVYTANERLYCYLQCFSTGWAACPTIATVTCAGRDWQGGCLSPTRQWDFFIFFLFWPFKRQQF